MFGKCVHKLIRFLKFIEAVASNLLPNSKYSSAWPFVLSGDLFTVGMRSFWPRIDSGNQTSGLGIQSVRQRRQNLEDLVE